MGLVQGEGDPPVIIYVSGNAGMPDDEETFADVVKKKGYTTGVVGKWHLGWDQDSWNDQKHGPRGHGFDYSFCLPYTLVSEFAEDPPFWVIRSTFENHFWVYILVVLQNVFIFGRPRKYFMIIFPILLFVSWFFLEHFHLMDFENVIWADAGGHWASRSDFIYKFVNSYLQENDAVVEKPIDLVNLADRLVVKSIKFIEEAAASKKPFLLFHSFAHVHTPYATAPRFERKSSHWGFGDTVLETDDSVGRILDALKRLKLDENTFVYLSSDHGGDSPQRGLNGGWNLPFRGGKSNGALEGGIRVPAIVKWPGKVKPGKTITQPTSMMDILPTIKEIIKNESPSAKPLDGESILSLLEGEKEHYSRTFFHHCGTNLMAIREVIEDNKIYKMTIKEPPLEPGDWNSNVSRCIGAFCDCHKNFVMHSKPKLYNIAKDISEQAPLNETSDEYKKVTGRLMMKIHEFEMNMINSNPVPRQFETFGSVMPRPWLQVYMERVWKD